MSFLKAFSEIMICILMLLPASLHAEGQEGETMFVTSVMLSSMINGKSWLKIDEQSKVMYLSGIEEGAVLLIAEIGNKPNEIDNARVALHALNRITVKGFKMSDIMKDIDLFYTQPSNRRIPVVDAYRYVITKFKGVSSEELSSIEAGLRKQYNN